MHWLSIVTVFGILGGMAWQGDTDAARREEIVKSMLKEMNDLTKLLSKIRDEKAAQSSQEELKKAADQWRALRKKSENIPPPSQAESELLAKQYRSKLEEAQKFLFAEIARIQRDVPGGKEALKEIFKAFDKKKG